MKRIVRTIVCLVAIFSSLGVLPALAGEREVIIFTREVMPRLLKFADSEKVHLLTGEKKEDFVAAAYDIARRRGRFKLGEWDSRVEAELKFASGFLCALPWWPKPNSLLTNLQSFRRQLTFNAYNRTVAELSIERSFFNYSLQDIERFVREKKPPQIENEISLPIAVQSFVKTSVTP
jgi:hypothetical protein